MFLQVVLCITGVPEGVMMGCPVNSERAGGAREQVLTWTASGIAAGWIVRTVMRSRRDFGVLVILDRSAWRRHRRWLFRRLGFTAPDNALSQILVALVGAAAFLVALRVLRRVTVVTQVASVAATAVRPVSTFEEHVKRLGAPSSATSFTACWPGSGGPPHPNQVFDEQTTFGERVADKVALFGGSWTFITFFFIVPGRVDGHQTRTSEREPFDP